MVKACITYGQIENVEFAEMAEYAEFFNCPNIT